MYLLGEQPAYADTLINRLQNIPARLLNGLSPCGPALEFSAVDDLATLLPGNQLFLLDNGLLHGCIDNRALFYLHEAIWSACARGLNCRIVACLAMARCP